MSKLSKLSPILHFLDDKNLQYNQMTNILFDKLSKVLHREIKNSIMQIRKIVSFQVLSSCMTMHVYIVIEADT